VRISPYSRKLIPKDRGEAERHRVAVKTFLDEWERDSETQRVFVAVRKDAGLGRKAVALQFIEAVTKGAPFPGLARIKRRIGSAIQAYVSGRAQGQFPWLAPFLVTAFVRDVG